MHKNTRNIGIKITLISIILIGVFQLVQYAVAGQNTAKIQSQNSLMYASATEQNYSQIWVAIGTWVGIRYDSISANIQVYGEEARLWETPEERKTIREKLLRENMMIIKEYLGLVKTDVLVVLDESENRRSTLDSLISQLELRYRNAATSMINLQDQKNLLMWQMQGDSTEIEQVKTQMSTDFTQNDVPAVIQDVDTYIELRDRITSDRTDVILINQFLAQYNFLNQYNKKLLDTLINNREAIISESYVVIPDSGDDFLKQFKLLYEEEEFKAQRE